MMKANSNYKFPTIDLFKKTNQNKIGLLQTGPLDDLNLIWNNENDLLLTKDLIQLENLLIVDTSVYGKNWFLNQLLISLLTTTAPSDLKLILTQSKKQELNIYKHLNNQFLAKLPGEELPILCEPNKIVDVVKALCLELDNRAELFQEAGVNDLKDYNQKFKSKNLDPRKGHQYFPYIVLVLSDVGPYTLYTRSLLYDPLQKLIQEGPNLGLFNVICTSQIYGDTFFNTLLSNISNKVIFKLNSLNKYKIFFETLTEKPRLSEDEFVYEEEGTINKGKIIHFEYGEIKKVCRFISHQNEPPNNYFLPEAIEDQNKN